MPPLLVDSPIRRVGPAEAALREQWADAIGLAWYAATPVARAEAQAVADQLWLELVALQLNAGATGSGLPSTEGEG